MRRHLTPFNVVATLVLALALMSTSWAAPVRHLITGKDVKNNSLTSKDVKDRSLTAKDFAKGQLNGAAGPAGPQGPAGAPGAESPSSGAAQLWAFRDLADPSKVNLMASFGVPQAAALGPELEGFRDDLVYSFHVDQNHDGAIDVRFDLRFTTAVDPASTVIAKDVVTSPADADLAVSQRYTLTRVTPAGTTTVLANQPVAPPNLGPRLTPNYSTLATQAIGTAGAVQAFAGPRRDPSFADASFADQLGLRPFNPAHTAPLPAENGVNASTGRTALMIALRLPITGASGICPGACSSPTSTDSVVGVAATTSRVVNGALAQTSVAGLPLVRELLTPIAQRATLATTPPGTDAATVARLRDPVTTGLLYANYPPLIDPAPTAPRDAVVKFLAGFDGSGNTLPPNNLLKINLAVSPTGSPNRLGVLGGDLAGFPNGRRLVDDVLDIELRVFAGTLEGKNQAPNNQLSDGVDAPNGALSSTFPYAAAPVSYYAATPTSP